MKLQEKDLQAWKEAPYEKSNQYPGNQLIMTFETKEKPLTLEEIDEVIQKNLTNSEERSAKYFNY